MQRIISYISPKHNLTRPEENAMRIALLADIHANLPALEAVLRDIRKKQSPDRIISL